jgi:hypothetical protein
VASLPCRLLFFNRPIKTRAACKKLTSRPLASPRRPAKMRQTKIVRGAAAHRDLHEQLLVALHDLCPGRNPTNPTHQPTNPTLDVTLSWTPGPETAIVGRHTPSAPTQTSRANTTDCGECERRLTAPGGRGPSCVLCGSSCCRRPPRSGRLSSNAANLGFGRIVASEIEVPNILVIMA